MSDPLVVHDTFSPQGQFMGFEMGAKALTLLYLPGFLRNNVNAPCPPSLISFSSEGEYPCYVP